MFARHLVDVLFRDMLLQILGEKCAAQHSWAYCCATTRTPPLHCKAGKVLQVLQRGCLTLIPTFWDSLACCCSRGLLRVFVCMLVAAGWHFRSESRKNSWINDSDQCSGSSACPYHLIVDSKAHEGRQSVLINRELQEIETLSHGNLCHFAGPINSTNDALRTHTISRMQVLIKNCTQLL